MGYKYEELMCRTCDKLTVHQIRKRYGKSEKGKKNIGSKSLRRTVTKCLSCQTKTIVGRTGKKRTHIVSFR
jgi:hypothetical protein